LEHFGRTSAVGLGKAGLELQQPQLQASAGHCGGAVAVAAAAHKCDRVAAVDHSHCCCSTVGNPVDTGLGEREGGRDKNKGSVTSTSPTATPTHCNKTNAAVSVGMGTQEDSPGGKDGIDSADTLSGHLQHIISSH